MSAILPINLEALLHCRGVESERVEFKASWDPDRTGPQVLRTICAFANDYHNLNGGYVVIGVAEQEGRALLPPAGLSAEEIEAAQQWIRGHCNRLDPPYPPVLSPESIGDRLVLVVWAPASEMRPHRARALLEFAQTKIWLAGNALRHRQYDSRHRFLNEARTLLERVVQLDASPARHAWAWRELARTRNWLKAPAREVEDAYRRAIELLPDEPRFAQELDSIRSARRQGNGIPTHEDRNRRVSWLFVSATRQTVLAGAGQLEDIRVLDPAEDRRRAGNDVS